jgi:uncharacterized protein (DUF924 family)
MPDKIHELLDFWFGDLGSADLPTSNRTSLWFGENTEVKKKLIDPFLSEYEAATSGALSDWGKTPRGRLALIILFDQFSRFIHKQDPQAFAFDEAARKLCLEGLQEKMDQSLTLIERVFFYMPLVHAEDINTQEQSIRLYQELVSLSMSETTQIYQLFLAYAYAHFRVIHEFGRFPQRNKALGRDSTEAEATFLRST